MSTPELDTRLTERVVARALQNVREGGKPFACLIVRDGKVLVEAANQVAQSGDPTSHAEITAIRLAAEMGVTDLTGLDVYVTAYPCPMCLGALYYAQPDRVVFAASRDQESEHYEDGNRLMTLDTFYGEYTKPAHERALPSEQVATEDPTAPFRQWSMLHAD
ncbi:nucleoside deaminase [Curtobacterium sp. MCLR17_007]|uniref:nucleoside deaminase n=1 Tax=Curtobacterium sp. MCLR17_007 TaxID=2175648 RepID=UPI000DA9F311|nr:nucleoside deaminase [Curtobacterium sp. MCLR17_007]WIB59551.1 nucleoside deaminase [Curtobacterium sp. MCLR17_007]